MMMSESDDDDYESDVMTLSCRHVTVPSRCDSDGFKNESSKMTPQTIIRAKAREGDDQLSDVNNLSSNAGM